MLKARPGIMDIAPYKGGDAKLPGQTRVMRLASNESPLGASPQRHRGLSRHRAGTSPLSRRRGGGSARRHRRGARPADRSRSSAAPAPTS